MTNRTELPDLDRGYLKRKLATIVRDLSSYTAQEMARELVRLAKVADEIEVVKEARRAQPESEWPRIVFETNPGGLGHNWVKQAFERPEGEAPHWGPVRTVGDLVRNLTTLEQDASIVTAFHIDFEGTRRCRAQQGITISRERVIDGRWIDSTRKDVPHAYVLWAKPDERAAALGALLEILRDVHDTLASESDSDIDHFEDDEEEREGAPVQYAARKVMEVMDMLKAAAPSAPGTLEAPKKPAHGHRDDYYMLANGRRLGLEPISRVRNMPNWVLAMELFATGSTSAHQLCRDAGIDPDSTTIQRAAQLDGGQGEGKAHA